MIAIENPVTIAAIEIALHSWLDLLANEDYVGAYNLVMHDPYYGWTPKIIEDVINGYGLPCENDGSEIFKVTDWRPIEIHMKNSEKEIVLFDHPEVLEKSNFTAIGEIWYNLPLNDELSDLTVTFRVLQFQNYATLELNEIHVM